MALADFFPRDTIAISQVLKGFQTDTFTEKLEGIRVAIAFGEEAATSRDGRELLNLSVRLAARLYPSLTFATVPAGERLADDLIALASSINPNIETSKTGTANVGLSIGVDAPAVDTLTVYAGCDGWLGRVGTKGPYRTSDLGNPFGAGFARLLGGSQPVSLLIPSRRPNFIGCRSSFSFRRCLFPASCGLHNDGPLGVGRCWSGGQQCLLGTSAYAANRPDLPGRSTNRRA